MIFADIFDELGGRGLSAVIGLVLGGLIAWLIAHWRRRRQRRSILAGDARDTVVVHLHLLERSGPGPENVVLRIRAVGQSQLDRVVPNGHLAAILMARAFAVTPTHTLISMEGTEGSYLLETLTGFVCDRVGNAPFPHELYVMAPCCEPKELANHQPITIILISRPDLEFFSSWAQCRHARVEHGSDGARVLTLISMARRFHHEQEELALRRSQGQRTQFVETMYVLDLALDRICAVIPSKPIPWGRYEAVLKAMNLE